LACRRRKRKKGGVLRPIVGRCGKGKRKGRKSSFLPGRGKEKEDNILFFPIGEAKGGTEGKRRTGVSFRPGGGRGRVRHDLLLFRRAGTLKGGGRGELYIPIRGGKGGETH